MRCTVNLVSSRLPGNFAAAGVLVRHAREHEKEIGEPVQVADDDLRDLDFALEMHNAAFGAAADCSRDVQRRGFVSAAWNDEAAQGLQLSLAGIDGTFQLCNACFVNARFLQLLAHLLQLWRGEYGSNTEQVSLNRHEDFIDARERLRTAGHPDHGIELIDVAVCFDARMIFANAAAAE
jgi:hypothetical protein